MSDRRQQTMTSPLHNNNKNHHNHHARTSLPIFPPPHQNSDNHRDLPMPDPAPTAIPTNNEAASTSASIEIDGWEEDSMLAKSEFMNLDEVVRRRSRRLKQLIRIYREQYWALMEELKIKYREYYWEYGKNPARADDYEGENDDNDTNGDGGQCGVHGCKSKAMALTKFCHTHILSDAKQKLYIGCNYVIKSSQAGPILCGKPILRSTIPALCPLHFQKAEKHVARALKKAGSNANSPSKLAPKFHVIVAEYVRQIQTKRRAALRKMTTDTGIKEEEISI